MTEKKEKGEKQARKFARDTKRVNLLGESKSAGLIRKRMRIEVPKKLKEPKTPGPKRTTKKKE